MLTGEGEDGIKRGKEKEREMEKKGKKVKNLFI